MRRFWQQRCGPLNSIWEQPYQFAVWWTVANVFGIAGFVLPIFLSWTRSKNTYDAYLASLKGGSASGSRVIYDLYEVSRKCCRPPPCSTTSVWPGWGSATLA